MHLKRLDCAESSGEVTVEGILSRASEVGPASALTLTIRGGANGVAPNPHGTTPHGMRVRDGVIAVREAALDTVLGGAVREVLNGGPVEDSPIRFLDLAANLRQAIQQVKATAIDESGRRVDYAGLVRNPAFAVYRGLTPALRELNPAHIITRHERLAFWLNLYNGLVIDAVITYGIRQRVTEGRFGAFGFFRRAAYNIGGLRFSCDDIEHGILRGNRGRQFLPGPQFGTLDPRGAWIIDPPDARVHFALNCGSRSCPPISTYDADRIDGQLTLATRSFLNLEAALDAQRGALWLPRVFRRFAGDFGGRRGVIAFLLHYLPDDERRSWLEARGSRVRFRYHRYDWRLNVLD